MQLKLGDFAAVTQTTRCSSHLALVRGLPWPTGSPAKEVHVWRGARGTGAQLIGIGPHGDQIVSEYRLDLLKNRTPTRDGTVASENIEDKFGIGDQDWIETDILWKWMDRCRQEHGHRCKKVDAQLPSAMPRWFIDTVRLCLVEAEPGKPYVALSYVWGAVSQYKTVREDLELLQQDGYLDNEEIEIPRTIKDAIGLVPLLGERYLWVDSLCIVQEDGDELWDQINNMASIYANASLTIVAAQGQDALFGLHGIQGISQPRRLLDEVHTLQGGTPVLMHGESWFSRLMPTKYSHRAWTFQEYLFSRRKIIFKDDTVYWQCASASWEEEIAQVQCSKLALGMGAGSNIDSTLLHRNALVPRQISSLTDYARLVYGFNTKELTYPEDVPYAFAGIATMLSKTFVDGIVCGLPAMFLDVALLWESHEACMKRRLPIQMQDEATTVLPSWSWMGWKGRIDISSWKSGNDYLLHTMSGGQTHTIPTVVWHVRESVETDLIRVESTWCKYRTAIEEHGQTEVPDGWTRHHISFKDLVGGDYDVIDHPDGRPYAYRRVTGRRPSADQFDRYENYSFPIPLVSPDELAVPRLFTPLLSGCTERTWFYLGARNAERSVENTETQSWHKIPGPFSVIDSMGVWVGIVQSNFEPVADIAPQGQKIELVAISRGWCWENPEDEADEGRVDRRKPIAEWDYAQRPKGEEKYEWYNVLWVERRKGTAYRKSIGRIEKSAWESQRRDSSFLKLG